MERHEWLEAGLLLVSTAAMLGSRRLQRYLRKKRYERGGQLTKLKKSVIQGGLLWGDAYLPATVATSHFLVVGTTGSGKTLIQRRLMQRPLCDICPGSDQRALIFDAKGDTAAYLKKIGVTCPVYALNPFQAAAGNFSQAVAWDVAADITTPARAQNLAASLIPEERGGSNRYFTDAARQVTAGVIESFIRHSGRAWSFPDLVYALLSHERIRELLCRDADGEDVLSCYFGEEKVAYSVFTTIASRLGQFKPVAALWQRSCESISVRQWLKEESILLLAANATAKTSLECINEQFFRVLVEEIDEQRNSTTRRTWIWIDEARLSGPLLRSDLLPYLCVKGRSRGACVVLAFQNIEGLREAASERIANEIVAQCSNIALLRQATAESAKFVANLLGQYETLEAFTSETVTAFSRSVGEQRVMKDVVIASEFCRLPLTTKINGLTGYFVSPVQGAWRGRVVGEELESVIVDERAEWQEAPKLRPEADQWLRAWAPADRWRLGLEGVERIVNVEREVLHKQEERRMGERKLSW